MRRKNDLILDKIEGALSDIKLQYDIFFNGGSEQWPERAHGALQREIERVMNIQSLDYAQRYRLHALASRLTAYGDLWKRNIASLEQGRKAAFGVRKGRFEKKT